METEDRALLDQWIANWSDLVDCEVRPVIGSTDAAEKIAPRLWAGRSSVNQLPSLHPERS
jgi:hypothetical protein